MPNVSRLDLVDRLMEGQLERTLRSYREDGVSFELIARRFEIDHDVQVSGSTIRSWCHHYGIDGEREAS